MNALLPCLALLVGSPAPHADGPGLYDLAELTPASARSLEGRVLAFRKRPEDPVVTGRRGGAGPAGGSLGGRTPPASWIVFQTGRLPLSPNIPGASYYQPLEDPGG